MPSRLDRTIQRTMARRKPATVHGMLVVDKPAGMTSHDVVGLLRRRLGERRIGHAGTLDPDATGVLVVGVGNATRLMRYATAGEKTYQCEVVLGSETSTLDSSGEVTARHHMVLEPDEVREASKAFLGEIQQVPPMVSAVRVGGRRLHELAREGVEVERAPRHITVSSFDLQPTSDPLVYRAVITCSAGTYVRTLGADLGSALGGGAHIRALRRTASGSFGEDQAAAPDEARLRPVVDMVGSMTRMLVSVSDHPTIRNGGVLPFDRYQGEGPWAVVAAHPDTGGSDELLAVHELVGDRIRVGVVIPLPS